MIGVVASVSRRVHLHCVVDVESSQKSPFVQSLK